jgi:PAS domain-containing protein
MKDQVQALVNLSSSLVEEADREVSRERAEAIESGHRARRQLVLVLPATALLTLLVAVGLGWYATRSMTDPVKMAGTSIDITERKRAEDALRRSEAYLASAQKLTHTGSYQADQK